MKRGLYRTHQPELGDCARVHWWAGDAAPYLERAVYEAAAFEPPFASLPTKDEYASREPLIDPRLIHTLSV